MRKIVLLFAIVMLALIVISCAPTPAQPAAPQVVEKVVEKVVTATPPPAKNEQVTLTVAGWIAMEESGKEPWRKMVEGFEKKYPNIKIKYIGYPWAQQLNQLILMVTGGNPPDVAQIDISSVALYSMGALEPLNDKFPAEVVADLYDASKIGGTYGGKLLAWPWVIGSIGMIYNPTLFEKAGLDPNKPPQTLDQLADYAVKIDQLGPDIYGLGLAAKRPAAHWTNLLWSYNGDYLDKDGNIVINSPESVQAVKYFKNLIDKGAVPTGSDIYDFRALFSKDKMGFYFDAPASRGILEQMSGQGQAFRSHYRCMPMPTGTSSKSEATLWGHWLTVFKASPNKDAAYKFIEYVTSDPEIVKMYYDSMGMLPSSKKAIAKAPFAEDAFAQCFLKTTETARSFPASLQNHPQFAQMRDLMSISLEEAFLQNKDPKAALDGAAKSLAIYFPTAKTKY